MSPWRQELFFTKLYGKEGKILLNKDFNLIT